MFRPVFCELSGYSAVPVPVFQVTEWWFGFAKHSPQSLWSSMALLELSKSLKFLLNNFAFDQKNTWFLSWKVKNAPKMCYVFEVCLSFWGTDFFPDLAGIVWKCYFAREVTTMLTHDWNGGLKSIWKIKKLFKVLLNNFFFSLSTWFMKCWGNQNSLKICSFFELSLFFWHVLFVR